MSNKYPESVFGLTQNPHVLFDPEDIHHQLDKDSLLFEPSKFAAFHNFHTEKDTLPVLVSVFTPSSSVVLHIPQNDTGVVTAIDYGN